MAMPLHRSGSLMTLDTTVPFELRIDIPALLAPRGA